jgi:co-chaperonin GroES (HSP10)
MIQPLKDYLLVRSVEATWAPLGLYVPEDATVRIQRGEVVATGSQVGRDNGLPIIQVGDVVLYSLHGANELREEGKKYFLVQDKEVWAKIVREG